MSACSHLHFLERTQTETPHVWLGDRAVWRDLGSPWTSENQAALSAQHCHKNSPGQGRQVPPPSTSPQPCLASEENDTELTARGTGMWLGEVLRGDSPATKGGDEYAVLVITLCTSQFVFQYVISIIKLLKQWLMMRAPAGELGEERVDPHPNNKIAFSEELLHRRLAAGRTAAPGSYENSQA